MLPDVPSLNIQPEDNTRAAQYTANIQRSVTYGANLFAVQTQRHLAKVTNNMASINFSLHWYTYTCMEPQSNLKIYLHLKIQDFTVNWLFGHILVTVYTDLCHHISNKYKHTHKIQQMNLQPENKIRENHLTFKHRSNIRLGRRPRAKLFTKYRQSFRDARLCVVQTKLTGKQMLLHKQSHLSFIHFL